MFEKKKRKKAAPIRRLSANTTCQHHSEQTVFANRSGVAGLRARLSWPNLPALCSVMVLYHFSPRLIKDNWYYDSDSSSRNPALAQALGTGPSNTTDAMQPADAPNDDGWRRASTSRSPVGTVTANNPIAVNRSWPTQPVLLLPFFSQLLLD